MWEKCPYCMLARVSKSNCLCKTKIHLYHTASHHTELQEAATRTESLSMHVCTPAQSRGCLGMWSEQTSITALILLCSKTSLTHVCPFTPSCSFSLAPLIRLDRPEDPPHKHAGSNVAQRSLHDCQPQTQRQCVAEVECGLQQSPHITQYLCRPSCRHDDIWGR